MNLDSAKDQSPSTTALVASSSAAADLTARYARLRERARTLCEAGDLSGALAVYDQALEEARRLGEIDRIDRALCNRMAVAIGLGDCQEVRGPLRAVLMRRASDASAFLAADNLSRAYEETKEFKKGLFYAQVARRHAEATQNPTWLAMSYNQEGNCLTGDSHFERAASAYRRALELLPETPSPSRAGVMLNLGYCAVTTGREDEGMGLTFSSLRWFRRFEDARGCGWAHLDLCHAYALRGRPGRAVRHGQRALAFAEETAETGLLKNALFVLGEAAQQDGDIDSAYSCFDRLQRDFYPDQPKLVELLLAVDLRQVVNLRA